MAKGKVMNGTKPAERQQTKPANFRFDASNIEWKDFLTEGCYYRILDVNVQPTLPTCWSNSIPGAAVFFTAT